MTTDKATKPVKATKAVTKTATKPVKEFKDNEHSDDTIRNIGKLISIGYKNQEIAKYLNIHHQTVSKIRTYLKRISWCSNDFVRLARSNVKTALQNGDLKLSEKVLDTANQRHAPVIAQQQQSPTLTVNVGSLLDELVYTPAQPRATVEPESHEKGSITEMAGSNIRDGEIIECGTDEGVQGPGEEV
jgi:hypothetical protein